MGTSNSKTTETPRSYSSSSVHGNNYGRSSSSYERTGSHYAPSAPSWNTVYSSSDNTLRSRATEHPSYHTNRNYTGSSDSYNSRSATASACVSTVSKPPPSATVANNRLSSSTTGPKPSSTAVASNPLSSTPGPKPSSTHVANNKFSSSSTGPKPSSTTIVNDPLSVNTTGSKPSSTAVRSNRLSSTPGPKPSSTHVANNKFSSSSTGPKPSSTTIVNDPLSVNTTGSKPSSTAVRSNPFLSSTPGPKPSSTTIAYDLFSANTTAPKQSSTVVANSLSSRTTAPKPLYPSLNELKSSSSVPSRQVISSTTAVSKPLFSAAPASSLRSQACKKEPPEVTPSDEISDGDSNPRFKAAYKKRNDCKFYYYTKCSKGDRCDFRHEPAAFGSKRVCCLWKHGKCLDEHCQFRHMNLENNKDPCYWEEKRGSCTVKECPFQHLKSKDKQDDNDPSEAKVKKGNNENKPKVHTRRRRLRHGPIGSTSDDPQTPSSSSSARNLVRKRKAPSKLDKNSEPHCEENRSISDMSQLDEDEVRDSSVTQKEGVVSLLELLQKLEEAERNLKGDGHTTAVASEPAEKSGIIGDRKLNDCKYFYYSKCSKGNKCVYRHDPTSLGCNMVCHDWQLGKCNRYHCKFRHMILENNPMRCCWENKAGGCQVQDCPFQHKRSNDVEGNNEENDGDLSEGTTENKGGNNAGNRNKNRKPKHRGGKRNRSAGHTQADKEEQSMNPTAAAAAAAQGLSAALLQQVELKVKEAQMEYQKKLEEERANAMEKIKEEHEKLANMKLEEKTKEIYEKLEGFLNCSICFEMFVSPVTLNCSHTFCQFCIKEWRKYEVNCPLCRKHITSEARALNIDNLIEEMMPDFSEEMKQKREKVIKLREIYYSLP